MRNTILLLMILIFAQPISAQNNDAFNFESEDGAVQFDYLPDWTLVDEYTQFKTLYRYDMWTMFDANEFSSYYLDNENKSRILLEVIHPRNAGYPDDLSTAADYANYLLGDDMLESAAVTIGGNTAIRAITARTVMPKAGPDTTLHNTRASAQTIAMEAAHVGRFYVFVRHDGWIVVLNLATPEQEVERQEQNVIALMGSVVFDANAASTPFERPLARYDVGDMELSQTFTSDDAMLTLDYPEAWQIDLHAPRCNPRCPPAYTYGVYFIVPDSRVQVHIMVADVTRDELNLPPTENTSKEYVRTQRTQAVGSREYRVDGKELLFTMGTEEDRVHETILLALNETWIAVGLLNAPEIADLQAYEPSVVAALNTLKIKLGETHIQSDALKAALPDGWYWGSFQSNGSQGYLYLMRPVGEVDQWGPRLRIELLHRNMVGQRQPFPSERLETVLRGYLSMTGNSLLTQPSAVTLHDYEGLRAELFREQTRAYGQISLYLINEDWVMIAYGASLSQAESQAMVEELDVLLGNLEITLPEG